MPEEQKNPDEFFFGIYEQSGNSVYLKWKDIKAIFDKFDEDEQIDFIAYLEDNYNG